MCGGIALESAQGSQELHEFPKFGQLLSYVGTGQDSTR